MLHAETARCVDCYTLQYEDEMNLCEAGHWTCPECSCDCALLKGHQDAIPSWLRPDTWLHIELPTLADEA